MRTILLLAATSSLLLSLFGSGFLWADDCPQWGEPYSRNMVSSESNLPEIFDPGTRNRQTGGIDLPKNSGVRWVANLGNLSYGSPIIAGGKVFVGTNNGVPRDQRISGDRGILSCFDEKTGKYLWQFSVPKLTSVKWADWQYIGFTSPPTVEGNRAYAVTNRCEVVCLDVEGMANGNSGPFTEEGKHMALPGEAPLKPGPHDADIVWLFDIIKQTKAEPHNGSNCSILLDGDLLYICTSNGVEWTHSRVLHPEAPSVIVLNKKTGKLVARDDFDIGPDITHGQWSSPSSGVVGKRRLGFFGAGNGHLYAYEMLATKLKPTANTTQRLKNVWKFRGHPLAQTQDKVLPDHQHDSTSYEVTSIPVFYKQRVYVPFTQEAFHRQKGAWLTCLDATRSGDITRTGLVWSYDAIGSTVSTVAIAGGLVYAADFSGRLHCLDAETGECYWVHNAGEPIWGSPLVADGKVYLGTGRRFFWILRAKKELEIVQRIRMHDGIFSTPVAANGVLYVMTNRHLYAVGPVKHHATKN